jgi:hypothetical protein
MRLVGRESGRPLHSSAPNAGSGESGVDGSRWVTNGLCHEGRGVTSADG